MKATFTYYLSTAGQKAALAAGGDGKEKQTLDGEIQASDLDLFSVNADGALSLEIRAGARWDWKNTLASSEHLNKENTTDWGIHYFDSVQTVEQLIAARRQILTRRAAKIAEDSLKQIERDKAATAKAAREKKEREERRDAVRKDFFADERARADSLFVAGGVCVKSVEFDEGDPVTVEAKRRAAADKEAKRIATEARDAEEARREEAKQAQIAEYVKEHGTESQKERFAAGLLPREEIVEIFEAEAFAPLSQFTLYDPITASNVRATCDSDCACEDGYNETPCEVSFSVKDAGAVSESEWKQVQAIKAALADEHAVVKVREHVGECGDGNCSSGKVTRRGIFVKRSVGAFTFTRAYALSE